MSTGTPSPSPTSVAGWLGADSVELVRIVEQDLANHEGAINEHQRTALAIRGLSVTSVAALVAGSYASFVPLPDYFAVAVALLFLCADYYYSRLYTGVEQRLPVLRSLLTEYRRLLGRPARTKDEVDDFRGDLRGYSDDSATPDTRPRLWPIRSLGRLKVFLPVYISLALAAGLSAWYVGAHRKPGSPTPVGRARLVCLESIEGSRKAPERRLVVVKCPRLRTLAVVR